MFKITGCILIALLACASRVQGNCMGPFGPVAAGESIMLGGTQCTCQASGQLSCVASCSGEPPCLENDPCCNAECVNGVWQGGPQECIQCQAPRIQGQTPQGQCCPPCILPAGVTEPPTVQPPPELEPGAGGQAPTEPVTTMQCEAHGDFMNGGETYNEQYCDCRCNSETGVMEDYLQSWECTESAVVDESECCMKKCSGDLDTIKALINELKVKKEGASGARLDNIKNKIASLRDLKNLVKRK